MRRLLPTALVLLATAVCAAPAAAESYKLRGRLEAGPQLAGDALAWAQASQPFGGRQFVRVAHAAQAPRTVFRTRDRGLLLFDAGPGFMAFDWSRTRGAGRSGTRFTPDPHGGPLDGPFQPLISCKTATFGEAATLAPSDIDGSTLVTDEFADCDALRGSLIVRDLATGTATPVPLGGRTVASVNNVAIAGPYVAFVELQPDDYRFSWVTVLNWQTGTEAYRTGILPLGIPGMDLQPDGTLAVSYLDEVRDPTFRTWVLDWYSVADPNPHRLPFDLRRFKVRMAGGRIFADLKAPGRHELALLDLEGGRITVATLALPGHAGNQLVNLFNELAGSFDFDGQRVAYATRRVRRVRAGSRFRRKIGPLVVRVRQAP